MNYRDMKSDIRIPRIKFQPYRNTPDRVPGKKSDFHTIPVIRKCDPAVRMMYTLTLTILLQDILLTIPDEPWEFIRQTMPKLRFTVRHPAFTKPKIR